MNTYEHFIITQVEMQGNFLRAGFAKSTAYNSL